MLAALRNPLALFFLAAFALTVAAEKSRLYGKAPWDDQPSQAVNAADDEQAAIDSEVSALGSDSFSRRRAAFLQLWQTGRKALPKVQVATESENLQVAQAASVLETLLLLNLSQEEIGPDVFDLLTQPTQDKIAQLCERRHWKLAEQILKANDEMVSAFQDSAGRYYLNRISEAALTQGNPELAWPLIRLTETPRAADYDGSSIAAWLSHSLRLELSEDQLTTETQALLELYAGNPRGALAMDITDELRRKILTRYGLWTQFKESDARQLILLGKDGEASKAAEAVLWEFSGNLRAAEDIWNKILPEVAAGDEELRSDSADVPDGDDGDSDDDSSSQPDAEALRGVRFLESLPAFDEQQALLALLLSGRASALERYFEATDLSSALRFYAAGDDHANSLRLAGLNADVSNFDDWVVAKETELGVTAGTRQRASTEAYDECSQICNLIIRLGFREEGRRLLTMLVKSGANQPQLFSGAINRWMSRGEQRSLFLDVLEENYALLPATTKQAVLEDLFPEFESSVLLLEGTAPRLVNKTGEGQSPHVLQLLDKLHSWDTLYFAEYGTTIADWLARAERSMMVKGLSSRESMTFVLQLNDLVKIAHGCDYDELAIDLATSEVAQAGTEGLQIQWVEAAKILIENGDAAQAAQLLERLRAARKVGDQMQLILNVKAQLLAGEYDQALKLDQSRWLRPLAVSRFGGATYYSTYADDLTDEGEFAAALDYAKIAFELSDFSSTDTYWAASDVSKIHEEQDNLPASANALRAPLAEGLMPGSQFLAFQIRNGYFYFLRYAAQRERVHRAFACIVDNRFQEARHHIEVGRQLQPQDIEMVVQCFPKLIELDQSEFANELFDSYEQTMLKQIQRWPNDATALNNLAWMYANCERKLDEALRLAQSAVSNAPSSAVYLDTLAEVHFRSGRIEAATAAMKQCIRMDPRDQHYRENLVRFTGGER